MTKSEYLLQLQREAGHREDLKRDLERADRLARLAKG